MSISSQAKRRAAELHNRKHEAKLNQHYAAPLFRYLQQLCYPIELVRQERKRKSDEQHRKLLVASLLSSATRTIGIRNRGGR